MRYARPRHNPADQGSLVKAITAAVVLADAFATGVAHTLQAPEVVATISEARRLDWEEHMDDLENRKAFLRYYRMRGETGSAYFPTFVGKLEPPTKNVSNENPGIFTGSVPFLFFCASLDRFCLNACFFVHLWVGFVSTPGAEFVRCAVVNSKFNPTQPDQYR